MFDPTAFENMKVVIEGYLYDKDLEGELRIVDRNDLVNLAKLSREFSIHFQLRDTDKSQTATFILKAGLENLSAELLKENVLQKRVGCYVVINFELIHPNEAFIFDKLQAGMEEIWGENRHIQQCVQYNPFMIHPVVQNKITIDFNRIILEDQIDDLIIMIDHMIETLAWLQIQL